ncbi:hypothetical protein M885DRAFT_577035, partial [Pelagophyceae sp. CCMP2097]
LALAAGARGVARAFGAWAAESRRGCTADRALSRRANALQRAVARWRCATLARAVCRWSAGARGLEIGRLALLRADEARAVVRRAALADVGSVLKLKAHRFPLCRALARWRALAAAEAQVAAVRRGCRGAALLCAAHDRARAAARRRSAARALRIWRAAHLADAQLAARSLATRGAAATAATARAAALRTLGRVVRQRLRRQLAAVVLAWRLFSGMARTSDNTIVWTLRRAAQLLLACAARTQRVAWRTWACQTAALRASEAALRRTVARAAFRLRRLGAARGFARWRKSAARAAGVARAASLLGRCAARLATADQARGWRTWRATCAAAARGEAAMALVDRAAHAWALRSVARGFRAWHRRTVDKRLGSGVSVRLADARAAAARRCGARLARLAQARGLATWAARTRQLRRLDGALRRALRRRASLLARWLRWRAAAADLRREALFCDARLRRLAPVCARLGRLEAARALLRWRGMHRRLEAMRRAAAGLARGDAARRARRAFRIWDRETLGHQLQHASQQLRQASLGTVVAGAGLRGVRAAMATWRAAARDRRNAVARAALKLAVAGCWRRLRALAPAFDRWNRRFGPLVGGGRAAGLACVLAAKARRVLGRALHGALRHWARVAREHRRFASARALRVQAALRASLGRRRNQAFAHWRHVTSVQRELDSLAYSSQQLAKGYGRRRHGTL